MGRSKIWIILIIQWLLLSVSLAYWDEGTTTETYNEETFGPRTSFFRWREVKSSLNLFNWFRHIDWTDNKYRRFTSCTCGLSIDLIPLSTGVILNTRTVITAANFLEPYRDRIRDLRIWALGRAGHHNTPYRYRVYRWRRLFPKSMNPEHQHGPRGGHTPRHDIAIVHSWDQIYTVSWAWHSFYPTTATLCYKGHIIYKKYMMLLVGSGFVTYWHIRENYNIVHYVLKFSSIVNCERYLPKWWGKFICVQNLKPFAGVQNGAGLYSDWKLVALGCFEIRYNEERIMVFTDLRYYIDFITVYANITPGEYYEYAYPEYMVAVGWVYSSAGKYIQDKYIAPRWWLRPPLG